MGQVRSPSASTQRVDVDGGVVGKNQRPDVEVIEVWSYLELLAPVAKEKCLLGPNPYREKKKLLGGGIGAPHKVLKAYMGEAVWLAKPTRGQKAQPPQVLA